MCFGLKMKQFEPLISEVLLLYLQAIYISRIVEGGQAARDGVLHVGDKILSVSWFYIVTFPTVINGMKQRKKHSINRRLVPLLSHIDLDKSELLSLSKELSPFATQSSVLRMLKKRHFENIVRNSIF